MRRDRTRGVLWMAAYVVCVSLVLSFIFFEVLDVDGSDFASPLRAAMTLKVTEPPQDIRRAPLLMPIPALDVVPQQPAIRFQVQQHLESHGADIPAHTLLRRTSRTTLARALL